MILFLFGTWGSGKSFVGDLIQRNCNLPHMEADLLFDQEMRDSLSQLNFHQLDLTSFFGEVLVEMKFYQRRCDHFVVSQAIYREDYRKLVYDSFSPDIRFIWVQTPDEILQMTRLDARAEKTESPVTSRVYTFMKEHWDAPQIPHMVLRNDERLGVNLPRLLAEFGLCEHWGR
jgi:gluconate kinase